MSEWKSKKLGDFIKVKHGYAFKGKSITDEETDAILVTPGNFKIGGGFKSSKFKYFNSDYPEDYVLSEGDIVVTMTDLSKESDTLGYSAKIPSIKGKVLLHNQRIGLVEFIDNDVSRDYLYWLMRTAEYQWYCVSSASGTSIMHTSPSRIEDYDFKLPPPSEQHAIASVLSSLDDKIDLLHRQNQTLEQMAETLFRQWFVENPNPEWEERPLSEFGQIICGKTPSKKKPEYFDGEYPFIKIPDMHGKTFVFDTQDSLSEEGFLSQEKKALPAKSINVSCIATVGLVTMNAFPSQTNQQINSIITDDEYRYYLYCEMKNSYDLLHAMASGGTATLNLNTGNFSKIPVLQPDEATLDRFNEFVSPMFDKIFENQTQIRTLTALRDTLLPKLMSGEVRVSESTLEKI
ncbi:restriction endonuclease subunit S [Kangiella sp.]|uniref:restriction endonuclease subunit S n=1 Tax=Kangiella sp. TaxID=1920245 RepID=UPI00199DF54C|nr:restriction endonuclease subunit S [Kangiella sp.]MBD3654677.1 restriction endonuclease subunit S [Kangiella sp.]